MKRLVIIGFLICGALASAQTVNTTLTFSTSFPKTKSAKPPVLIMLHGYGSNEVDLLELSKSLDPRLMTFSLRAPRPTSNGGFCWYNIEFLNNGQFKYDYAAVVESRAKILSFISNACKVYQLDSTQVFILGFSQGAIMAYDIALTTSGKVKGVLALSGRLLEESKQTLTRQASLQTINFFIGHGRSDAMIKIAEGEKANNFFKEKGVRNLVFKNYDMPHSICEQELRDINTWLSPLIK